MNRGRRIRVRYKLEKERIAAMELEKKRGGRRKAGFEAGRTDEKKDKKIQRSLRRLGQLLYSYF